MGENENISLYPAIVILEAKAFEMEVENDGHHVDQDKKRLNQYALKSIDRALRILRKEHEKVARI